MMATEEAEQRLDAADVLNAKRTLVQLLARAGVHSGDAEHLIGLVEAGSLAVARDELGGLARGGPDAAGTPEAKDEAYVSGWLAGAGAVTGGLAALAERVLRETVGTEPSAAAPGPRSPVTRMEVERAKVAVLPLYLSFTTDSDLDPEVSEQVLTAVLGTMTARRRAGYAGRLTAFASEHRARVRRMYAEYGPGSAIAIHGRYSLLHSPTSIAVLERLVTAPAPLREEWDAAELPPAWLDGLGTAWDAAA
ncbi:hypothetical protein SLA_0532 [Streptomyces laurentii]|uniref:Uncharacterized protein n=1 Tax=Streptomyces laurentii TaxID=39478 RepID=A0A160NUJ0_STRLU|nr:hypothetical protein SLA_0532 [Streptomyces laurentii]